MSSLNKRSLGMLTHFVVAVLIVSITACSQAAAPSATAPAKPGQSQPAATKDASSATNAKPGKKELVKITVPFAAISGVMAPLWITKERGLFEKYGLDVDVQYIASSTTLTQAMLSGEIKLAETAANPVVEADLAGADLVIIAGTENVLAFSLYTIPSIQRIEDLKGKAIGVSRYGSSTDFGARQTLRHFGLEPGKDVAILETGGSPETLAALQAGGVQGAVFGPPSTVKARQMGMRELVHIADLNIPYSSNCFAVSKKYMSENPEIVKSFLKALVEGIATAKNDKEFAKKVIGKYTKTEDDAVNDETYEYYMTDVMPRVPYASVDSMKTVLADTAETNPKAKETKPESLVDNSIIKELDDSGFIKKLYGQ